MSLALLRGCTVWVCFIYKKRKNIYDLSLLIFHVFGWSVTPGKASAALLASSGIVTKSILSHWVDLPTQSLLPDGLLQVWLLPCLLLGKVWSIYCPIVKFIAWKRRAPLLCLKQGCCLVLGSLRVGKPHPWTSKAPLGDVRLQEPRSELWGCSAWGRDVSPTPWRGAELRWTPV